MSVCAAAGGSSVDEILLPCRIKASVAISVTEELGGCSHNAQAGQTGRQMRKEGLKVDVKEDMQGER